MKKETQTIEETKHIELVKKHLQVGDLITHECCLGAISEHLFTRWDGFWICGKPTKDTMKYSGCKNLEINDIAPLNVTHINRELVENIDFLCDFRKKV